VNRLLASILLLGLAAVPASGQKVAPEAALAAVDSAVAAGDYARARALLQQWWTANGREAPPALRARALLLRGRLTADPRAAEGDYLAIVLEYPVTAAAPTALRLLGQSLVLRGEFARAETYLARLIRDHPRSPERQAALLWLARARRSLGKRTAACEAARAGIAMAGDPDRLALLHAEAAASCGDAPAGAARPLRFTVQVAALSSRAAADRLAGELRRRGFQPRVARIPGSPLFRVRVGQFADRAAAAELAARLTAAGYQPIIGEDATAERVEGR